MCGICGVVSLEPGRGTDKLNTSKNRTVPSVIADRMMKDIIRIPRLLAMRRLSIIDLHTGQQPISNEAGDIWVVYNGEIYNFRRSASKLEKRGHIFKTRTDTEIIVHAYEEYGDACVNSSTACLPSHYGMREMHRMLLARDTIGDQASILLGRARTRWYLALS